MAGESGGRHQRGLPGREAKAGGGGEGRRRRRHLALAGQARLILAGAGSIEDGTAPSADLWHAQNRSV
eukprot:3947069-Alexandrium_andersonii.AAC.1